MIGSSAVGRAIDELLAEVDGGEDEAVVQVHDDTCLSILDPANCTCLPRHLLVPPARVPDIWWWARHVDVLARNPKRQPYT